MADSNGFFGVDGLLGKRCGAGRHVSDRILVETIDLLPHHAELADPFQPNLIAALTGDLDHAGIVEETS
ncbi:hypothetical protein ACOJBM_00260 [Rhizobium beringeri]